MAEAKKNTINKVIGVFAVIISLSVLFWGSIYYYSLIIADRADPFMEDVTLGFQSFFIINKIIDSLGLPTFFFFTILLFKGINNVFFNKNIIYWKHIVYIGWLSFWLSGLFALLKTKVYVYGTVGFFLIEFPEQIVGQIGSAIMFGTITFIILFSLYVHLNIDFKTMKQNFEYWLQNLKSEITDKTKVITDKVKTHLETVEEDNVATQSTSSIETAEEESFFFKETLMGATNESNTIISEKEELIIKPDTVNNENQEKSINLNTVKPISEISNVSQSQITDPILFIDSDPEEFYINKLPEERSIQKEEISEDNQLKNNEEEPNPVEILKNLLNTNVFIKIDENEIHNQKNIID